jgi:FkbM family methyltransferase
LLEIAQRLLYPISALWNEESNRGERVRRFFNFVGWQLWKRIVRRPVTVSLFNKKRFVAYPDCQVSSAILYTHIPNSRNILFLRKHISGGTLIDVGANVGSVSLMLADKIDHAILFEPNSLAASRARENLAQNGLDFEVYEFALSDKTGEVLFESQGGPDTVGRIVAAATSNSQARNAIVPCITFDDFLRQYGYPHFPVSVIKIDVEGHENSVLRGMRQFLCERRPPLIMFEYLQRTRIEETLSFFAGIQYRVFELTMDGPRAVTAQVEPLQDLFACPQERMATLGGVTPSP